MYLSPKPFLFLASLQLCIAIATPLLCSESQSKALLGFKNGLIGAEAVLSSWADGTDCCEWLGVQCHNKSNVVISLDLSPKTLGAAMITIGLSSSSSKLSELRNLTFLDLSFVNFTTSQFPSFIGSLTKLRYLNLSSCSLHGSVSHQSFSNLSELTQLDLSSNNRLNSSFPSDWIPPFRLDYISLRSTRLGPRFPNWLHNQFTYTIIDISSSKISDVIPGWFWNISSFAVFIDLSKNQISGEIVGYPRSVSLSLIAAIDLSSNQLEGTVPSFLFRTRFLDVSMNNFSSLDLPCATQGFSIMSFLDASNNQISGNLRDCWSYFVSLDTLSLSNNKLSGKIPPSIGALSGIRSLKLNNNGFTGEVPLTLRNCTDLRAVDFGRNRLSGTIPDWIGTFSPSLTVLVLRSNQIRGTIPRSLCLLSSLQILDLSSNAIVGTVPDCIGNLTAMRNRNTNAWFDLEVRYELLTFQFSMSKKYREKVLLQWKGVVREFGNTLRLVKIFDISSNKLSGGVPVMITNLSELVSLNLSRNELDGQIPIEIGALKLLDALDLSRNSLIGQVPSSLAQIARLSNLDLSYNNLSGEIPRGTQLQSFRSAFSGNPELCGDPLPRLCPKKEQPAVPPGPDHPKEDSDEVFRVELYISAATGFVIGFWGLCGTLIFNKRFRYTYYGFSDRISDRFFVIMTIQKARFFKMIRS